MTKFHFQLGRKDEAAALVKKHHYSRRVPNMVVCGTWHTDGGLFGDSGEAIAACIFSTPPTRWSEPVLELVRLVRTPECDAPLSGLVSQTSKWCKQIAQADLLVSFADWTQTHHGGIYQAASWNYDGKRSPRMDGIVIDGVFVPGRTANAMFGTRSPARLHERGIKAEPHYDLGKHLYWRALNKAGQRKAERLGLKQLPYPKPHRQSADEGGM